MATDDETEQCRQAILTDNQLSDTMLGMENKRIKLTDQLRKAIETNDKSRYQIGQETGIDPATLCRFIHGKGGLSIDGLDRIADCLGLNLTTESKPPSVKKSKGK